MADSNTRSVKTVSNAIKRQRKRQKTKLIRRWLVRILIVTVITITIFGVYYLDRSTLFRVKTITVSNNTILSNQEVIDVLDVHVNDRMWLIYDFLQQNKVSDVPSIESFSYKKQNNVLMITINESKPVGVRNDELLLANGKTSPITPFNNHYRMTLPIIRGFEEPQLQSRLTESLSQLDQTIMLIIDSVTQHEVTYDQAQLWLILSDQRQVFSDFRSLYLLNNYPLFVDQIASGNNCIYLDATSQSARSARCE